MEHHTHSVDASTRDQCKSNGRRAQDRNITSSDVGLYQPAKKLQMARNDLNNLILRPGELHIVMDQLRTIGCYIENSGIDLCWVESNLYGPTTTKQIIEGKHVKRGETAHMVTLQALFALYQKAFLDKQDAQMVTQVDTFAKQLGSACLSGTKEKIIEASARMEEAINSLDVIGKMKTFDEDRAQPDSRIPDLPSLHAYGNRDDAFHESCPNRGLETPSFVAYVVYQVLFRPRSIELLKC